MSYFNALECGRKTSEQGIAFNRYEQSCKWKRSERGFDLLSELRLSIEQD